MPVIINNIQKRSLASRLPIAIGHTIIRIDSKPVDDILDVIYYSQKSDFVIEYSDLEGVLRTCSVHNDFCKPLGIGVDLPACVSCVNSCIFCFIDQMPPGMRDSLYVKDDDFIYSFFYGNFITLTNLSESAFKRIISQRLMPLYVSVHTTNPKLHRRISRYTHDFDIMKALRRLDKGNIEVHAQIVLMPGINDKEELQRTLSDLIKRTNITSIGIVPVGVTKYRVSQDIRKYSGAEASEIISEIETFKKINEVEHIYAADEFFIMSGTSIPSDDYYHDYVQIENGIGMVRKSLMNWKKIKKKFNKFLSEMVGTLVFVTSVSGAHAIKPIIDEMKGQVRVCVINNQVFGEEVTVTGLLTWADIKSQVVLGADEYMVFSSGIFNVDMKTLDDVHISEIQREMGKRALVMDEMFCEWAVY